MKNKKFINVNEIAQADNINDIKVTKDEYHANKRTGNYYCKPIYFPNLGVYGGYNYYKKAEAK